jgi:hypothetical protein
MEGGVKNRDLRFFGKQFCGNFDPLCGGWIMQRRQVPQLLDPMQDFVCDQSRFAKFFSAMNDAVTDRSDIEPARLFKDFNNSQKGCSMICMLHHLLLLYPLEIDDIEASLFGFQTFCDPGSKHSFRFRI